MGFKKPSFAAVSKTGRAKGQRHGKANQEVIALVQTVGNEVVGPVTDNVYRKEEMDVRETTEVA